MWVYTILRSLGSSFAIFAILRTKEIVHRETFILSKVEGPESTRPERCG